MPEPLGNLVKGDTVLGETRCEGVPELVPALTFFGLNPDLSSKRSRKAESGSLS